MYFWLGSIFLDPFFDRSIDITCLIRFFWISIFFCFFFGPLLFSSWWWWWKRTIQKISTTPRIITSTEKNISRAGVLSVRPFSLYFHVLYPLVSVRRNLPYHTLGLFVITCGAIKWEYPQKEGKSIGIFVQTLVRFTSLFFLKSLFLLFVLLAKRRKRDF